MSQAQYLIDDTGTKTGVLLSIKEYEKLLEDLHDLAVGVSQALKVKLFSR
jgi:hypothetical protein